MLVARAPAPVWKVQRSAAGLIVNLEKTSQYVNHYSFHVPEPAHLAQIADTVSSPETAGRLREVCDRWIYTACLCFGLDVAEQRASGFAYDYSVYQVEYSRDLNRPGFDGGSTGWISHDTLA